MLATVAGQLIAFFIFLVALAHAMGGKDASARVARWPLRLTKFILRTMGRKCRKLLRKPA